MNNQEKNERVTNKTTEATASEFSTSLSSFSSLFIYRPVATTLLMCAIMIAGILGYNYLPVAPLPQVDYPTIQVTTYYPGANPDLMATAITAPLERQLGQVSGLSQMYSQNGYGISVITLQFDLALSMAIAEQEVQAAMNAASQLLPKDLPYPPIYNKVNPADPPILTIAITSNTLPMTRVADLVQNRLIHQIAQVNGIGLVSQSGGQRPAIRVIYNQEALASYQIDSEMLRSAIARASVNTAKGSFDGPERSVTLSANDQLTTPQAYDDIIIKYNKENQGIVRLGDVAEVVEGAENKYLGAWTDGVPAIILNIHRQPGANVIETVDKIKALLPELIETLPKSLNVEILMDRTLSIRASIHDVQIELFFAIGLVILVIYLFLRDVRATLIASIAVPLSLVGTFAVIYLLGYSINNLTLMALTIATGFVVDDAIVVIENISRYLASKKGDAELKAALGQPIDDEEGLSPFHAALVGAKEIGFTIISLTLSLVAVLIPLLFMGEIVGRLFHEFAVTLAIAILISGVISLTLTPMLCAKLLKSAHTATNKGINAKIEKSFNYIIALYGSSLKRVLNHPKKMLLLIIGTLIVTLALYIYIPKGFFPLQDNSLIQGTIIAPQSSSFQQMSHLQTEITQRLETHDSIERVTTFVGIDNTNLTLNSLQVQLVLTPLSSRVQTINEVMDDIHHLLADIPDVQIFLQPQQDLTIDTQRTRTPYRFSLSVRDIEQLNQWIPAIENQLGQLPELRHLSHDWQNQGIDLFINVNRDIASRLGISMSTIHESLYNAFGQRQVSTLYTHTNQYRIVLEGGGLSYSTKSNGLSPRDILSTHYLTGGNGQMVPLSALATLEEKNTLLSINRLTQFPVVTFYFDVNNEAGYALENAIDSINKAIDVLNLPKDMNITFQGASLAFNAALTNTVFLLIAAIITMYIVLGILYESFIHPVTILSTLPTAAIGALLSLILLNKDFDMIAVIGVILLIGIVKKNAIMMIDFALVAKREQGLNAKEAITQACLLRFRPILMTTMAAVLGAIPLMLGQGVGSELRQPLGITLVGGLLLSQLLTLYTTPIIYLLFDKLTQTNIPNDRQRA